MPRAARRSTSGSGSPGAFCRPSVTRTTPSTGAPASPARRASASAGCQSVTRLEGRRPSAGSSVTRPGRRGSPARSSGRRRRRRPHGPRPVARSAQSFAAISRRTTSRRERPSIGSPGLSLERSGEFPRASAGRPGSAVSMLCETSTATITRPRNVSRRPAPRSARTEPAPAPRPPPIAGPAGTSPPAARPAAAPRGRGSTAGPAPRPPRRSRTRRGDSPPAAAAAAEEIERHESVASRRSGVHELEYRKRTRNTRKYTRKDKEPNTGAKMRIHAITSPECKAARSGPG